MVMPLLFSAPRGVRAAPLLGEGSNAEPPDGEGHGDPLAPSADAGVEMSILLLRTGERSTCVAR